MNKIYKFFIVIGLVVLGLSLWGKSLDEKGSYDNKNIYLFNWGDYMDPEILTDFEKETGYKVIYESFDSNEAMLNKVEEATTPYDLVIPSDYAIEMMVEKDLLKTLDKGKIKGLENIDPAFLDLDFDPGNNYSVPYFWGSLGIIYNTDVFNKEDLSSWQDLWDDSLRGQVLLYDGARELMMIGLLKNGLSVNETEADKLKLVASDLEALMANTKAILADEINMYMVQEEGNIGVTFSGLAAQAMEVNDKLAYLVPEEGSNIWFDNMVIPKTSKNTQGAYELISYLLRPDVAAKNAEYIRYSSPNKEALKYLAEEDLNNTALYPPEDTLSRLDVFHYLGREETILYNNIYLELKLNSKSLLER